MAAALWRLTGRRDRSRRLLLGAPPPRRAGLPCCARGAATSARALDRDTVAVTFDDGLVQRYHWLWLRDNCLHESQSTANGQRLFETADLVRAHREARVADPQAFEVSDQGGHLAVTWKDGHASRFPLAWLRAHAYDQPDTAQHEAGAAATSTRGSFLWGCNFAFFLPEVSFELVQTPAGRVRFAWLLERFGFALVRGVPTEPGMVERVGNMVGAVRNTNYGTTFDVLDRGTEAKNLADTAMAITQHTDNPYRDPVPGIQLLHCLEQAAGDGGETLLVDGFAAAERLREQAPRAFELLSRQPRAFRYMDADRGTDLRTDSFPVLEVDHASGAVRRVRFNNRSAAPLKASFDDTLGYFEAWERLQEILQDPELRLDLRLAPGDLVAFQNHRVLHGRRGYQRGARRHLQGAYIDVDGVRSTLHGSSSSSAAADLKCPIQQAAEHAIDALSSQKKLSYGEGVSMLQHALQCAACATEEGASDEEVLGALFHDVGNAPQARAARRLSRPSEPEPEMLKDPALGDIGYSRHDGVGAEFLQGLGFGPMVVNATAMHVSAKRYLCATDSSYFAQLSPASVATLRHQGGPMTPDEVERFSGTQGSDLALRIRAWDDRGKDPKRAVPQVSAYRDMVLRYLEQRALASRSEGPQ